MHGDLEFLPAQKPLEKPLKNKLLSWIFIVVKSIQVLTSC